ncbi:MAG: sulfoxide reductase heme-binding subunit YedZ [Deltaproteobacteria bacterium]|nr:MAG: sulfoxide reductase heme-binding subunit YedZ [Deltaproteobacteria bacterium]
MAPGTAARPRRLKTQDWVRPAVYYGSLVPLVLLAVRALTDRLGANPIAEVLNQLGLLGLVFLVASLACTPLKIAFGWKWPVAVRRTLGLFAFFTLLFHFVVYLVFDQQLDLAAVLRDVGERPFITVGLAGLVLMVPLAVTSTRGSLKRLGARRWQRLHRLAYLAGALGVVHYLLRVKADATEPLAYGAVLGVLFLVRLVDWARRRAARSARATP